jgi:hypothetical protein
MIKRGAQVGIGLGVGFGLGVGRVGRTIRRAAPAALLGLALAGCGGQLSAAEKAQECVALASDVVSQGLAAVPSQAQARELGNRLDGRLSTIKDPTLHDAAVALHSHVHAIETAAKKGDSAKARQLAEEARADVSKAAKVCGLPEAQFLG